MADILKDIPVFSEMKASNREELNRLCNRKRLKKGEILFQDKEVVSCLYVIRSGMAALYKINGAGEKKVIFVLGAGQMINEVILDQLPASVSCEIFENAEILSFRKDDFLSVMEKDFALTRHVVGSMSVKIRRLYRQLKNTAPSIRGDKKLAAKLYKLARDYGVPDPDGILIDLKLSITYLADMLGSKRETVSRQLKLLSEKNLVIFKRQKIIITDLEVLSRYFKE